MPPTTEHGAFHWNELMTRSLEKAKAFYAETLGWQYETFPAPSGAYTLCKAGGSPVGGMFEMTPGGEFDGIPDHWFAYVAVDDVDARLAKVEAAGGAILRSPFDVPEVGRIAIVKDSAGAAIGWITPALRG